MAERHAILQSRALATLRDKDNRVSVFKDGYGDFCFRPPEPIKCWECDFFRAPTTTQSVVEEAQSLSINDYSSSLQVSFLALPKDIRDIIYAYWLLPFRNPLFGGSIKVEIGVVHARRCHPFRNGYDLRVPSSIVTTRERHVNERAKNHVHVARADYLHLLALSQASHKIREELGALFWKDVYVDMDHWEYLFLDFLNDRPAIWKGIKKLRMQWSCHESATSLNEGWGAIIDFCVSIEHQLELDECVFVLDTTPWVVREILAQGENIAWVRAFKKIKMKKLTMELSLIEDSDEEEENGVLDDSGDDDDSDDDSDESNHSLEPELVNDSGSAVSDNDPPFADEEESDSSSSSSSSSGASQLSFEDEEERTEILRRQWNPLLEELLGPPRPSPSLVNPEDEYLAERRALE